MHGHAATGAAAGATQPPGFNVGVSQGSWVCNTARVSRVSSRTYPSVSMLCPGLSWWL